MSRLHFCSGLHIILQQVNSQSGIVAFLTGNEPEVTEATWSLPVSASKQKTQKAAGTSSAENGSATATAEDATMGGDGSRCCTAHHCWLTASEELAQNT